MSTLAGTKPTWPTTVAALFDDARHGGCISGEARRGEAADADRRVVRVGLWIQAGRVVRAGFQATSCVALIALAESACRLLEAGVEPQRLEPELLCSRVSGLHPAHRARAELVVAAVRSALSTPGGSP